MKDHRQHKSTTKAQTATELAVFGAVLLFILAVMLRYSLNAALAQNHMFQTMRLAMAESFKSAERKEASRNSATIIFVEDRTAGEITKYGAISRSPLIMGASATFSKNLFMPIDWGEFQNVPVMDVFVNGQHFALTTAAFKEYNIGDGAPPPVDFDSFKQARWDASWDPACTTDSSGKPLGCRIVFEKSPNMPQNKLFDVSCASCFDLYRDGSNIVPPADRPTFTWQWHAIKATSDNIKPKENKNLAVDVDGDLQEEYIIEMVDIDGFTYTADKERKKSGNVPIKTVRVMDYQAGDIDQTYNDRSPGARPGLNENTQMYTFARDGTVLLIEEGKLKGTTQMVRSTQTKDTTDIIQRVMQLTNDTGRLCGNGSGQPWDAPPGLPNFTDGRVFRTCTNPGCFACNDCFSDANIFKTCFDEEPKILYIRSRIGDLRGRRWVTDFGGRGY